MGDVKGAQALVKELKKLLGAKPTDDNRQQAKQIVKDFKRVLAKFRYLPPSTQVDGGKSKAERSVAMEGYEYACILSANRMLDDDVNAAGPDNTKNLALERHVLLLRPYYFDYRRELGDSSRRAEILGLELLALLVGQELGDFYSLLERIPLKEREDKHIKYVTRLLGFLMEGNYNQLLQSRKNEPSKNYKTLLAELDSTVQKEIASCIEQAYDQISIGAAAKLMNCKKDVVEMEAAQRENWVIENNGIIRFQQVEESKTEIPKDVTKKLIKETLGYAHELERIV